ncbi:MAG: MBL fold metallo-hydrolase [Woeseiaceae bacterium]|nr:MBL fold metallo-hydrolase [Woeseiaceae bacterium]|tara:strand:+ start:737 stop:1750 length:1014 start_codon:yes stop_codon:yes gene_type:complete
MLLNRYAIITVAILLTFGGQAKISNAQEYDIKLTFLGTGAPRPSPKRYGPSILLEAGDTKLLVDAGPGMRQRIFQAGGFELLTDIDTVLITHLHFDHTIELPNLWLTGWLFGRKKNMQVYGPEGTEEFMNHFEQAFDWDLRYRYLTNVHVEGSDLITTDIEPGVFYNKNGIKITAFDVAHLPMDPDTEELLGLEGATFGYRVDYKGRSVVFSGDTRSLPGSKIIEISKGVDVLVHETQIPYPGDSKEAKLANVSMIVHSSPEQVAYVFNETRPRLGIYHHIIPPETTRDELLGMTDYDGRMEVAEDLMTLMIGDEITVGMAERMDGQTFLESDAVDE